MRLFLLALPVLVIAAEPKPRVFVTESGALAFTGPTTSENIEVMKAFQRHCPSVAITSDRDKADFVVRLDREGPSPVTPFVKGNKVAVFNRDADLVYTNSSRTLAPSVKGACAILTRSPAAPASPKTQK
ncbi:MAG: hypothetical protein JNM66_15000 [Bryobacterales bacterium]|nr:hypothetical protein [Bryobacterales bacterium]